MVHLSVLQLQADIHMGLQPEAARTVPQPVETHSFPHPRVVHMELQLWKIPIQLPQVLHTVHHPQPQLHHTAHLQEAKGTEEVNFLAKAIALKAETHMELQHLPLTLPTTQSHTADLATAVAAEVHTGHL